MRYYILLIIGFILCSSCDDKKKTKQRYLADASGAINNVSVVVDNDLWSGDVGEAMRRVLAKPIYGLPQDEPTFTMSQIPPSVFSGFVTKNRTILKIEHSKSSSFQILDDVYAKPQKVIVISATTKKEIIQILEEKDSIIIKTFRESELKERLRQMSKSPHKFTQIKEKLGVRLQFSSIYRLAKQTDHFFWIRKDITTGTNNLLIYELPLGAITKNDSTVSQIIKIRDSIGKQHVEGPLEGSYLATEKAYAPFHGETIIDGKTVLETKGIWDVKNAFMGGPFINYAIEDQPNNRWVVVEGFTFAPSVAKRNYMLELEAIIKAIKIE